MQPLRDYLNESPLQYEGILDPDQNKVMSRMADATDDMIRQRIREYCTYDRQKYARGEQWAATYPSLEIVKIDKDNKGWYIETENTELVDVIYDSDAKSVYDYCLSEGQKIDMQKGFLIEDIGVYFRWRKHSGTLSISAAPNLESTDGLPEELYVLRILDSCQHSKKLNIRNKIKVITLSYVEDIKILGKGCKNVIIDPKYPCDNIIAPDGVKIHYPEDYDEYDDLRDKLSKR